MLLSSCSYKVQTKTIVLKDNNNQPYPKIIKRLHLITNRRIILPDPHNSACDIIVSNQNQICINKNNFITSENNKSKYKTTTYDDLRITGYILWIIFMLFFGLLCVSVAFAFADKVGYFPGIFEILLFLGIIYLISRKISKIRKGEE